MHNIPFFKPSIGPEEIEEVVDTLKSGWLTTGPKVKRFEEEFAECLQHSHAVAVNSCTAALHLALEAIGVVAGDTVIVPTMTFAATAEVARYFNARPVLVDCQLEDFNLDVVDAERKIETQLSAGQKVVAILPVHYGGLVGDVAGVSRLAKRYSLKVVEDAAHCGPSYYRADGNSEWKSVGSDADISCYSFYANKTITTGEGGMACTNYKDYADRMRIMSLHGISRDAWKRFSAEGSWYYEIVAPGFKYNLTDIAASIGLHQIRKMKELHRAREQLVSLYRELLEDIAELALPQVPPNRIHSWHLFVIRLKLDRLRIDRSAMIVELKRRGIGTSVHWLPLHMHPYYREKYGYRPSDLPNAARLYPEVISLPLYPGLTEGEVKYICSEIKDLIARHLK